MKKLESITVNKIVVAMETMNTGRVIVFAYSDSSVEYRDRRNMLETFNDNNLDRVWHLSQIGFSYTEDEPCTLHVCFRNQNQTLILYRLTSCSITKLLLRCANTK